VRDLGGVGAPDLRAASNEGVDGGPRTPTVDPVLVNNSATETTTVRCPKVRVIKTVSYDGKCPGLPFTTINQTAQPVTFCYAITNVGDTFLDNIHVVDVLKVRTQPPVVIFDEIITSGPDPLVPLAPGETVLAQVTIAGTHEEAMQAACTANAPPVSAMAMIAPANAGPMSRARL
jgi:hypothetical protein